MRIKLTFEEAIYGCKKDINLDVYDTCSACDGKGGFNEQTCSKCHGSGSITTEQRTIFGSFMSKVTCPNCGGLGKSYKEICSKCGGNGFTKEKRTITVSVPSGVDTGNRLRLNGKGEAGTNGGPSGDLYLEFIVEEHKFYKRDNNDIYLTVPLSITEAILGCKKEIPTITGNVTLTIPSSSNTGDKHRLKGKGIKNESTRKTGDMYIILEVKNTKRLSRDQKHLLEELSKTNLESDESIEFDRFVKKSR